jgi:undecaprenyl diphosphate synthase
MAQTIENSVVPRHVGYIVDGNRRWAREHGLPAYEGHLAGYNALKEVALATLASGVEYMSAYVFSTENWKRSSDEVSHLFGLTLRILQADIPLFLENNVRLKVIGTREGLSSKLQKAIVEAEEKTATMTGGTFVVCLNYGGQLEIADALRSIIVASGTDMSEITPELIGEHLYCPEVPPIDLVVRTSGEQRLSNFMLWRAAYSEFLYLDKNWPEMTKEDVTGILEEYSQRKRRFGG